MAFIGKVTSRNLYIIPLRGFTILLQPRCLKTIFKIERTVLEQNVRGFSILRSVTFNLYKSTPVKGTQEPPSELYGSTKVVETAEIDENINKLSSVKDFYSVDLSQRDLIGTFRELVKVYWDNNVYYKRYDNKSFIENDLKVFTNSDEFKNYCNSMERILPILSAYDLKFLLNFDLFHVSPSSTLMQKIYHLLTEKINVYSGTEALEIYIKVNHIGNEKNSKCCVLLEVCEKFFWYKLFESQEENINYNIVASFVDNSEVPFNVRKRLAQLLRNNFVKAHNRIGLQAFSKMFRAFSDPRISKYFIPEMFSILQEKVSEGLNCSTSLNINQGLKHLLNTRLSYDEKFFREMVELNIKSDPNVIQSIVLAVSFLELGHFCFSLIQHLKVKFTKPEFILKTAHLSLSLGKVLSTVHYHPFGYDGNDVLHIEVLKKLNFFDFEMFKLDSFIKWCLNATVLGIDRKFEYLNKLFEHLTETYKDKEINEDLLPTSVEKIITLSAFATKYFPNDVKRLPKEFLEKCHNLLKTSFPLDAHEFLSEALKKSAQVFENCTSSVHHLLDFVVLVNDEKTINVENNCSEGRLRIEDIQLWSHSRMIIYQMYRGDLPHKFRNTLELPGQVKLFLKTFDQFHCKVVLIGVKHLSNLRDEDKKSYLMSKIKEGMTN